MSLRPGLYVVGSWEKDYGDLLALVDEGRAVFMGERYDVNAEKLIAVNVPEGATGFEPNVMAVGSIRIGREFFTGAIKDYEDWQEKWWREAVQNAVDAGATEVSCLAQQQPDGTWLVSCQDNGSGMDEDTLLNKFLVLGATAKKIEGAVGGFGKAKELLLLPWISWEVHSRNRVVKGAGIDYGVDDAEMLSGTRLSVLMPGDQTTTDAAALSFLGKCDLPSVRFTVNGERVKADLRAGETIRDFEGNAELHYDKRKVRFPGSMLVRARGLYMFSRWVASAVKGQLIVEITGRSTDLLTANRDGFRDRALSREVENYVNQLAADTETALRKKRGLVREKFQGSGKFSAREASELRAAMEELLGRMDPEGQKRKGGTYDLSDEQVDKLGAAVKEFEVVVETGYGAATTSSGPNFRASSELVTEMLRGIPIAGANQVEAIVKQLSWEPDFFVINDVEDWNVPKKFYPATMTANVRKLARFWAEMCRFVLMQLNCGLPFGVGFNFDSHTMAAYLHDDGHWLLLNPFRNVDPQASDAELYDLADWMNVMELYASAVHEATHMADGITYHDESFAAALTRNVARTSGKEKIIRKIKGIVLAAEKELREERRERGEIKPRGSRKTKPISGYVGMAPELTTEIRAIADRFDEIINEDAAIVRRLHDPQRSWLPGQVIQARRIALPAGTEHYVVQVGYEDPAESGNFTTWDVVDSEEKLARALAEVMYR